MCPLGDGSGPGQALGVSLGPHAGRGPLVGADRSRGAHSYLRRRVKVSAQGQRLSLRERQVVLFRPVSSPVVRLCIRDGGYRGGWGRGDERGGPPTDQRGTKGVRGQVSRFTSRTGTVRPSSEATVTVQNAPGTVPCESLLLRCLSDFLCLHPRLALGPPPCACAHDSLWGGWKAKVPEVPGNPSGNYWGSEDSVPSGLDGQLQTTHRRGPWGAQVV